MFFCKISVLPKKVKAWDLKRGERFSLTFDGYSKLNQRFEIYLKVSHTKAVLDSVPEKKGYSIPAITSQYNGLVYPVVEEWTMAK